LLQRSKSKSTAIDHEGTKFWKVNQNRRTSLGLDLLRVLRVA
jgi:hypothetical protein